MTDAMTPEQYRALADAFENDREDRQEVLAALRAAAGEVDRLRRLMGWRDRDLGIYSLEIDKLRAAIETAPHDANCAYEARSIDPWCTCWKADAL